MPTTINGIGTKYFGKKNTENFPGVCQSCGRQGQLQNYETGLWFSVFYIPLLPLGRKQILNYCASCSRHHALDWSDWEKLKEDAVRRDMEAMSQSPDDPAAALKFFSTLLAFRKQAEAADLASLLQNRFGNHADVQIELGSWHESLGRAEQALACFQKALELAPDNLVAKRAVAFCLIRQGRLAEAIRVLETPPPLMPLHDPSLFVMLGRAFQDQHQHEEALHWFGQILAVAPQAGREKEFRKLVRTSERQTSQMTSMLPHVGFYRSPAFVWSAIALLVAGLIGFSNYYISQHRTLHVVNGLAVPVDVQLDDSKPTTVAAKGSTNLSIAEGRHRAVVSAVGAELQNAEFEMKTGFFDRFFKKPVFVLNAAGAALVQWEKTVYTPAPKIRNFGPVQPPQAGGVNETQIHYGQPFMSFDNVDYIFQAFPHEIKMKGNTETKTRVGVMMLDPISIFNLADQFANQDRQMQYAEMHLKTSPDNPALVRQYEFAGIVFQQMGRCREFLQTRLADRPVRIAWHRAYQDLRRIEGAGDKLIDEYRQWLSQDKNNSALLYLNGRLEEQSDLSLKFFDRALAIDKSNAYAWSGKAYHLELLGDFPKALQAAAEAHQLLPNDEDMHRTWSNLLLANKDYAAAEKDARAIKQQDPFNIEAQLLLLEALVAQGNVGAAEQAQTEFDAALRIKGSTPDIESLSKRSANVLAYLQEKYGVLLDRALAAGVDSGRHESAFEALLELDELAEAETSLNESSSGPQGFSSLMMSLAWQKRGDEKQAEAWRNKAADQLAGGPKTEQSAARMLKDSEESNFEEVRELSIDSLNKCILLIALAQHGGAERSEMLDHAEKLNYRRTFPHNFLQRVIASAREKK